MPFCGRMSAPDTASRSHELISKIKRQKPVSKPLFDVCPNLPALLNSKYLIIEKT